MRDRWYGCGITFVLVGMFALALLALLNLVVT